MPESIVSPVGRILREWRTARAKSQFDVAMDAGASPRHLSFIETGRSSPSRQMLLRLSEVLDIPLRERNSLFEAAGYVAIYRETPLDAPQMAQIERVIDHILRAHTISPAVVLNRRYDILRSNAAASSLMVRRHAEPGAPKHQPNLLRLLLAPDCLRPIIQNWEEVAAILIHRVRKEALTSGPLPNDLQTLLNEVLGGSPVPPFPMIDLTQPAGFVLPIRFQAGPHSLALLSTITTLGTPLDVTLQELRIEAFHPADLESEKILIQLLQHSGQSQ